VRKAGVVDARGGKRTFAAPENQKNGQQEKRTFVTAIQSILMCERSEGPLRGRFDTFLHRSGWLLSQLRQKPSTTARFWTRVFDSVMRVTFSGAWCRDSRERWSK
jgi:hypothetical protein